MADTSGRGSCGSRENGAAWLALYDEAVVSRQVRPDANVGVLRDGHNAVVRMLSERSS